MSWLYLGGGRYSSLPPKTASTTPPTPTPSTNVASTTMNLLATASSTATNSALKDMISSAALSEKAAQAISTEVWDTTVYTTTIVTAPIRSFLPTPSAPTAVPESKHDFTHPSGFSGWKILALSLGLAALIAIVLWIAYRMRKDKWRGITVSEQLPKADGQVPPHQTTAPSGFNRSFQHANGGPSTADVYQGSSRNPRSPTSPYYNNGTWKPEPYGSRAPELHVPSRPDTDRGQNESNITRWSTFAHPVEPGQTRTPPFTSLVGSGASGSTTVVGQASPGTPLYHGRTTNGDRGFRTGSPPPRPTQAHQPGPRYPYVPPAPSSHFSRADTDDIQSVQPGGPANYGIRGLNTRRYNRAANDRADVIREEGHGDYTSASPAQEYLSLVEQYGRPEREGGFGGFGDEDYPGSLRTTQRRRGD